MDMQKKAEDFVSVLKNMMVSLLEVEQSNGEEITYVGDYYIVWLYTPINRYYQIPENGRVDEYLNIYGLVYDKKLDRCLWTKEKTEDGGKRLVFISPTAILLSEKES
jgi:hypothetical protein